MSDQEKNAHLSNLVSKFNAALNEAVAYATEHKLQFRIAPCYGAGATFDGDEIDDSDSDDGWYASSQSC